MSALKMLVDRALNAAGLKELTVRPGHGRAPADQGLSFFSRAARRETFRAPVFLWITPLVTPRMICGSATLSAAAAASRFPADNASSTLRTAVRIWLFRFLLMAVRLLVLRTRFSAETWLGMAELWVGRLRSRGAINEFGSGVQRTAGEA